MNEVLFDLDLLSVVTRRMRVVPVHAPSRLAKGVELRRKRSLRMVSANAACRGPSLQRSGVDQQVCAVTRKALPALTTQVQEPRKRHHMPETYGSVYDRERQTAFESNEHLLRQIPVRVRFEVS